MAYVHCELENPIKAWVKSEYLYNLDESYAGKFTPCTIFGLSSFTGRVPTFRVLLVDKSQKDSPINGSIYDYIPPHAILLDEASEPSTLLGLKDLVYHNCMDYQFVVHSFSFLAKKRQKEMNVQCYFKSKDLWMSGKYILTLEWHQMNDLLHMVLLENGQIGFLPNHKIKFLDGPKAFPDFKKIYSEWAV